MNTSKLIELGKVSEETKGTIDDLEYGTSPTMGPPPAK
jgi:hypothetical protein